MHLEVNISEKAIEQRIENLKSEQYKQGYQDAIEKFKSPYWQGYLQAMREMIRQQENLDKLEQDIEWFVNQFASR